jgi:HlyD family secretion protein
MRERIAQVLRPEQKAAYERLLRELGARGAATAGRLWVLQAGQPRPVEVQLGLSDGSSTELLGAELPEGAEVIVGLAPGAEKRDAGGLPRMRLF